MSDELIAIFQKALQTIDESDSDLNDVKIMRAFIAQGFEYFDYENKHRTSKKNDYDWMLARASRMGVNA